MKNNKISKQELIEEVLELENTLGRRAQKRDDNALNNNAKKMFGSWNNLMKAAGYDVKYYQKIKYPKFNEDFAYFLGLLITDGHIYYNNIRKAYKVAIYTSYIEEKDMIIKLIDALFDYNAATSSRMYGFNKKPNYEIRISSKELADTLINEFSIPCGEKSSNVKVSKKIIESSIRLKKSFVRGVIDGDGYISWKGIKIASGSVDFLNDLRAILENINIHSTKITVDNKRTNTLSIRINKKEDMIKIKNIYNIGYSYPRKKDKINKI